MIEYDVTEQMCVQRHVVFFRNAGADIWFVNPTGGPWKTLRIPGAVFGIDLSFEKEEARPDIIACTRAQSIIVIIEAKDNINKLSSQIQIERYWNVFEDVALKLREILRTNNIDYLDQDDLVIIPGYLYPLDEPLNDHVEEIEILRDVHRNVSGNHQYNTTGLLQYVVCKQENGDLTLSGEYFGGTESILNRLAEAHFILNHES